MSKPPYGSYKLFNVIKQVRESAPSGSDYSFAEPTRFGLTWEGFLFAKTKTMFRPLGILDWAWYTPAKLRDAALDDNLSDYYTEMLDDPRSPANKWKDKEEEKKKKDYYAYRAAWGVGGAP
tara:strand:+ start:1333 stop:1695 length:363 start_codon:yes stop_codon:yes gene_type:complete